MCLLAWSMLVGCHPSPPNEPVPDNAPSANSVSEPASAHIATASSNGAGAVQCPRTLAPGFAVPPGARLIGKARGQEPLGTAILTMEAPNDVAETLSPLGEVETQAGEAEAGLWVEHATAQSTGDLPLTLICEYGDLLPGQRYTAAMLLLPLVPGNDYECTFKTPQGRSSKPASGVCAPRSEP